MVNVSLHQYHFHVREGCEVFTNTVKPLNSDPLNKGQPLNQGLFITMQAFYFYLNLTLQEWSPLNSGHKSSAKGVASIEWFLYMYILHWLTCSSWKHIMCPPCDCDYLHTTSTCLSSA